MKRRASNIIGVLREDSMARQVVAIDALLIAIGVGLALFVNLLLAFVFWIVGRIAYRAWLKRRYMGDIPRHFFWLDRIYDTLFAGGLVLVFALMPLPSLAYGWSELTFRLSLIGGVFGLYCFNTLINLYIRGKQGVHIKTHAPSELFGDEKKKFIERKLWRVLLIIAGVLSIQWVVIANIALPILVVTPGNPVDSRTFIDMAVVYTCWNFLAVSYVLLLGKSFAIKNWFIALQFVALAGTLIVASYQTFWPGDSGYDLMIVALLAPILVTPFGYIWLRKRSRMQAAFASL